MTDRLTQLQDAVNHQADNLCNGIGILQQSSPPTKFPPERGTGNPSHPSPGPSPDSPNYSLMFATMIARTAKDIDILIESLPSEESSTELQLASLRRLEQENHEATHKLREVIERGEKLLERVQGALSDISKSQMEMQKLDHAAVKSSIF